MRGKGSQGVEGATGQLKPLQDTFTPQGRTGNTDEVTAHMNCHHEEAVQWCQPPQRQQGTYLSATLANPRP